MKARAAVLVFLAFAAPAREGTLLQQAPASVAGMRKPLADSVRARAAGSKLYLRECAACHGRDREGGHKAPSLLRAEVCQATPGALFWVLRNGSLRRGMPSFAQVPDPQRWQIIGFLPEGCASERQEMNKKTDRGEIGGATATPLLPKR